MNGKLYNHNLVVLANADNADALISDTENTILVKWAAALTGQNQSGKSDYRLWQIILGAKGGTVPSGALEQRLVWLLVNIITGEEQPPGWNKYELIDAAAESGPVPPPPTGCFTLIGSSDCFTLIGSADPFEFIQ